MSLITDIRRKQEEYATQAMLLSNLTNPGNPESWSPARHNALKEIANHQWNNGTKNDAMVITRIAMRGLRGE